MNNLEGLNLLAFIKAAIGRNYKSAIRQAWMTGNYSEAGLEQWAGQLQAMRNTLGPSWLVRAQPMPLECAVLNDLR
jgi:hypothetical protein